jgi:hypothetical protein
MGVQYSQVDAHLFHVRPETACRAFPLCLESSQRLSETIHNRQQQQSRSYINADQSPDGIARVIYQSKNKESSRTFPDIIKRILEHLGLWLTYNHDPPPPKTDNSTCVTYDDAYSQIPQYDYWAQ